MIVGFAWLFDLLTSVGKLWHFTWEVSVVDQLKSWSIENTFNVKLRFSHKLLCHAVSGHHSYVASYV